MCPHALRKLRLSACCLAYILSPVVFLGGDERVPNFILIFLPLMLFDFIKKKSYFVLPLFINKLELDKGFSSRVIFSERICLFSLLLPFQLC